MEKQLRAAGYIRVSTQEQAAHGASLTAQENEIRKHCDYKGWELVTVYADRGISGHKAESRPDFLKMMEAVKAGELDVVVITYLSRFARNMRELLEYVQLLGQHKVSLVSLRENIDGSAGATGKLMLHIMAAMAEFERELMLERSMAGKAVKLANKSMFFGKAPFGYKWNKQKAEFEILPEEAAVFKRIVDLYLGRALPMKQLAYELNQEGVRGRHGRPFTSSVIATMLRNTAYYGKLIANRKVYKDGKRTKVDKPRSEWVEYELPPLIDKSTWDKIQARAAQNKMTVRRLFDRELYWLRDLVECGECGGKVTPHHGGKRKDGSYPRYYSCFWAYQSLKRLALEGRTHKCPLPLMRAEELEAAVWNSVVNRLALAGNRDKLKGLLAGERFGERIEVAQNKVTGLQREQATCKRAQTNAMRLLERELTPAMEERLYEELNRHSDREAELEEQIAAAISELEAAKEAQANANAYVDFLDNNRHALSQLAQRLATLGPQGKRAVVMAMLNGGKIRVTGDRRGGGGGGGWGVEPHSYPKYFDPGLIKILDDLGVGGVIGKYRSQPACQHGFSGPGRADHQQIVPAGRGDLERSFDMFLAHHFRKIDPRFFGFGE